MPNSISTVLRKTLTTLSRFKTSQGKSSNAEIQPGIGPSISPGKKGSKQPQQLVVNENGCSKTVKSQSRDHMPRADSLREYQAGYRPSCGEESFKASPSRRQVKAVIFEQRDDGEPTVTVIMTRKSNW